MVDIRDGDRINIERNDGAASASYDLTLLREDDQPAAKILTYRAEKAENCSEDMPANLILKVPSFQDAAASDQLVRDQFEHETETLKRLKGVNSVTQAFEGNAKRGKDEIQPARLRHFAAGAILSEWMTEYAREKNTGTFEGLCSVDDWIKLARGLVDALEQVHHRRVIHGDLRPEKIVLNVKNLSELKPEHIHLIDAEVEGLSETKLETKIDSGTFRRKYDSPSKLFEKKGPNEPVRLRNTNADWYAPTDVFSLGAVLLELACGRSQPLTPFLSEVKETGYWSQVKGYQERKSDRQLKNFILDAVKKKHNRPQEYLPITEVIMSCIRTQADTQASDLRMVSNVLDQFSPFDRYSQPSPISMAVEMETAELALPLRAIMHRRAEVLARDLTDLKEPGLLRISGSRAHLVDILITVLRCLKEGDLCRAVTPTTFFFDGNMGPYGRMTSALHLAAQRGVVIDWILVVDERSLRDRRVAEVLEAQAHGAKEMMSCRCKTFGMQFTVADANLFERILKEKLTFIMAGPENDERNSILLAPDYRGDSGMMSVLRLWPTNTPSTRKVDFVKIFRDLKSRCRPVQRYKR